MQGVLPEKTGGIDLRVSDLKQFHYCPRVVYYQYVLPVEKKPTYKMEKGKIAQEAIERLEARRKLVRYGFSSGTRRFNPWIVSRKWRLSGKLDLLIETDSELFPVDFKFTRGKPFKNHIYQLGGYAILLEDQYCKEVKKGFVYLIPEEDAVEFEIDQDLKDECIHTLEEIRGMILKERFPEQPDERGKCADCEYQNYCRDTW